MVRLRYSITVVYVWLPAGVIIGFFLALLLIVAMGRASKRAEEEAKRDRLRNVHRRKLGE